MFCVGHDVPAEPVQDSIKVIVRNEIPGKFAVLQCLVGASLAALSAMAEQALEIPRGRGRLVQNYAILKSEDSGATLELHGIVNGSTLGIIHQRAPEIFIVGG